MTIENLRLDTANEVKYNIGETIDLLLQISQSSADIIGDNIQVNITDPFDNVVGNTMAELIQDNLYVATWTIPLNIAGLYNINNIQSSDLDDTYFYLTDTWLIPGSSNLKYKITVLRNSIDYPIVDNAKIHVILDGISSIDGDTLEKEELEFTTELYPFYGSVEDIKSTYRELLNGLSNIDIALNIISYSKYVDYNMRPTLITRTTQYNNAVFEWVNTTVAKNLLTSILNVNQESKELDTLKITRASAGGQLVLQNLERIAKDYENRIYAGGEDTPYTSKLFTKGLSDPNRPNAARATLIDSDSYPWVNFTSDSTIVNIDGQDVEIRGARSITFRSIFKLPPTTITRLNETSF